MTATVAWRPAMTTEQIADELGVSDRVVRRDLESALAKFRAIDPDLDIASQWRSSLSVNYEANLGSFLGDGWLFGADILYSDIIDAYQWTDLRSVVIGTLCSRPSTITKSLPRPCILWK